MTAQSKPATPILHEHFQPGVMLGEHIEVYSDAQAQRWQSIFGRPSATDADPAAEQASMAIIMMMRAFLNVVAPRPPGNIHARQQLDLQSLPRAGETVRLSVLCLSKTLRRDRRYVDLQVEGRTDDGRDLFRGVLTLIWAA